MSVPIFLSSNFYYFERDNVSDVQTMMDDFDTQAMSVNNPAWTHPSTGLYKSPVDADGRWFDVLFTRVTQQKLEFRVRDANGATVCTRRINCPSTNNWSVRIFTSQYYVHIDVDPVTATAEHLTAGMLDPSPDAAHNKYVYGNGFRSTADSNDSYSNVGRLYMIDNTTPAYGDRVLIWGAAGNNDMALRTMNGSRIYRPHGLYCKPTGGATMFFAGRRYQTLLVDAALGWGAKVTVPIDSNLSGLFRVTCLPSFCSACAAMRIG